MEVWRDPEYFESDPQAPRYRDVAVLYRQREPEAPREIRVPVRDAVQRRRRRHQRGLTFGEVMWPLLYLSVAALVGLMISEARRLPRPESDQARCARTGGRWSEGEVGGRRSSWCTWGSR